MVARFIKQKTFGRDEELLAKLQHIVTEAPAQGAFPAGITVNEEGFEAIKSEIDHAGRLYGYAVFKVVPQKERCNVFWSAEDLDRYLRRFRLRQ